MPFPWPESRLPEVSVRPRFRSGLARASMVIRAKPPKGTGLERITATLDVAGLYWAAAIRMDPSSDVPNTPSRPADDGVIPVIAQIHGSVRVERLAEREDDGRDPGRAEHKLLPGHLGRDRVHRAPRVDG